MCQEKACGQDWDDICSYSTQRYVRIRDKKLGILNSIFVFLITVYIVGVNYLYLKQYRAMGTVTGTSRIQAQSPKPEYLLPIHKLDYCKMGKYCGDTPPKFPQGCPCRWLDQYDAVYPGIETSAAFLSTRIKEVNQTVSPSFCVHAVSPECHWDDEGIFTYFIAQPELFTLWVDHTLSVPDIGLSPDTFSRSATEMEGKLVALDGTTVIDPCDPYKKLKLDCPPYVAVGSKGLDIVPLQSLLDAAGVSLDDDAKLTTGNVSETVRYSGIVLVLSIFYTNMDTYNPFDVTYRYSVSPILHAEYKGEEVSPLPGLSTPKRTLFDRHGVRIVIRQSGTVGIFSPSALLVQAVTSLGLLAVSSAIVNFLAFQILSMRSIYKQYQTVVSVDFSDVEHLPRRVLDDFSRQDYINPRPAIFAAFETADAGGGDVGTGLRTAPTGAADDETAEAAASRSTQKGFLASLGREDSGRSARVARAARGRGALNPMHVSGPGTDDDSSSSYRSSFGDGIAIPGLDEDDIRRPSVG